MRLVYLDLVIIRVEILSCFSIVDGGSSKIFHISNTFAAYGAAMAGIPLQISYGGCQKICHGIRQRCYKYCIFVIIYDHCTRPIYWLGLFEGFFYKFLTIAIVQVEPEAASLNQNAEKIETPTLGETLKNDGANHPTLGETLKNDGANHVTNSRVEAQTNVQTIAVIPNLEPSSHDKNNDAPNCNTEFLKPVTTESAVNFSNQGAVVDSTTPRTGECSEPTK
ncbi:hypothetical protein KIW84_041555 [Lathyrus oleraceus]|uniref:Uncharacterized protein n=1 Tax=Pisum sativum TaxID=3888 RepID=A0A9D4XA66_PEA|nr:hypothetical protein KIW84_041555 [Pisum sativum]